MKGTDNNFMKTFESLEERQIQRSAPQSHPENVVARSWRYPRIALALSVLPGLGQIYNGETGKGLLFLGVSLANVALICLLFATQPVLETLVWLGTSLNVEPKINVQQALEIVHTGRSVTLVYLALILSFASYVARDAYDHALETRKGRFFHKFFLGLPEATSGSYLFHFSIICALVLMVIFFVAPPKPMPQQTDIELVQEVPPPPPEPKRPDPPKPKQEPPKLEPKKEVVKPKTEPRREPPKPTPVAVAVPTDKPVADPVVQSDVPVPETASAPDTGSSTGGSPNGTGTEGGGGDGADVDFGSYLAEVQKRIKKNWFPPRGNESKSCTLKFKVLKDGSLGKIKLVTSSGIPIVDQAASTAVKNSAPFPPLPAGSPDDIDIKFTFDYNVFNGKMNAAQ